MEKVFQYVKKTEKWLKIKIKEDNYKGYVLNKRFKSFFLKPTHKISNLKANIYKFPYNRQRIRFNLTFGSKIKVIDKKSKFLKFANAGWISKKY